VTSSKRSDVPRAIDVTVDARELTFSSADGRRIITRLAWFPRRLHARTKQRRIHRSIGDGQGIHWPGLDDDISVSRLPCGVAAP
jgi:hypothetical protein